MVTIQRLTAITFQDALEIWNEGFKGYLVDIHMTMDMYLKRMIQEGLAPEISIVAYVDGKPAGCVLNGIRTTNGKTIAWNGGTGVAPEFRRQGVGRRMIEACLEIYRENDVDVAFLEAIAANHKAIALYEQMGYKTIDRVTFLSRQGTADNDLFRVPPVGHMLSTHRGLAQDVWNLPFYNDMAAWQTQWQSIQNGESIIVLDEINRPIGYALYKKSYDDVGKLTTIALYQCEVAAGVENPQDIMSQLLHEVYGPYTDEEIRRMTINIRVSNAPLIAILTDAGFSTFSEQVFMTRNMKE